MPNLNQANPNTRVVNETYDAETETSVPPVRDEAETRHSKQHLETFSRDVPAVTTTSTV